MQLSEAIRLGAMLKPQGYGALLEDGKTCAIGAACDAIGLLGQCMADGTFPDSVAQRWPLLEELNVLRTCPTCGMGQFGGGGVIVHLNDSHKWTREQIADWVQTIEPPAEESKLVETPTPVSAVCD